MSDLIFPFGAPVVDSTPSASSPRKYFILGAFPSALHVRWAGSDGTKIGALPVDNEPEPFWDGEDAELRVEKWKAAIDFQEAWGTVKAASNGGAGKWFDKFIIAPLRIARADCWITDCLTTYRMSTGGMTAIGERFVPWAAANGLPAPTLRNHPNETAIVKEALTARVKEIRAEIIACQPETIVTLGNSALRVLRTVVDSHDGAPISGLETRYFGSPATATIDDRAMQWLPLAHSSSPKAQQDAHKHWVSRRETDAT
jgi:hypothetical protein